MTIEKVIAYQRENFPRDRRIQKDWKSLYILDNLVRKKSYTLDLLYHKILYLYSLSSEELNKELHGSDMSI